jgi:hypothetical protein
MTGEKVAALIDVHVQRYPELDILDVYKLLHQAVFGSGHAIAGEKARKAAREWLERESELLQPAPAGPLIEDIHPDGALVRLHLRPYLAAHGQLNGLHDAFLESSRLAMGDPATIAAWWAIFQALVEGPLGQRFDSRAVRLEGQTRARENWPASHHSPRFQRAYKPAYRVLARPVAEELLRKQKIPFQVI